LLDGGLVHAFLAPERAPDIFLPLHGQRRVDAMGRHPIDLALQRVQFHHGVV
jgi:hypothetical protein